MLQYDDLHGPRLLLKKMITTMVISKLIEPKFGKSAKNREYQFTLGWTKLFNMHLKDGNSKLSPAGSALQTKFSVVNYPVWNQAGQW